PAEDGEADGQVAARAPKVPEGTYQALLTEWAGRKFDDKHAAARTEAEARAIAEVLDRAAYKVVKVEQKDQAQRPQAPFTTSTLQQQASLRLHFSAQRTMQTAQRLYEGVGLGSEGQVALITYMRTDSTRVSDDALKMVRGHIEQVHGPAYLP